MELLILRHGKAEDHGSTKDFDRALVEKGYLQSRLAGHLVKSIGLLPDLVLSSPLVRARQTAEEFCTAAGIATPLIVPWLAIGMHPETALSELSAYQEFDRIAIVGHNPDLSELVQCLLDAHGLAIEVKKGSLTYLRCSPPSKSGSLIFHAPPLLTQQWA